MEKAREFYEDDGEDQEESAWNSCFGIWIKIY